MMETAITEKSFSYKGVISVGALSESENFRINLEAQEIYVDGMVVSTTISFMPDPKSMGEHKLASTALSSKVIDKIEEIVPRVFIGARKIGGKSYPTFDLNEADVPLLKDVDDFSKKLLSKLQELERQMKEALINNPSGYTG